MTTVTYTNTRGDLLAFARNHYVRSPGGWLGLGFFVLVTLPATISAAPTEFGLVIRVLTTAVLEAALVGLLIAVYAVMILVALAFQRNRLRDEHTITVTDDAITESTSVNETVSKWVGVHKIRRSARHIYVYLAPGIAHVIPRRAVATDQEWADLYSAMARAWSAARA